VVREANYRGTMMAMNEKPTLDYERIEEPDSHLSRAAYRGIGSAVLVGTVMLFMGGIAWDIFGQVSISAVLWVIAFVFGTITACVLAGSLKKPD
jgi:hypothetical protein